MSANTLLTSVITGGTNSHTTVAEEANALATDFVSNGVVGAITLNTGSGGTGSFCVNADASPDMGVTIKAGQAYVTATPSSQNSQVLRVRAAADYTTYTINSNASGSTKYDWIYLSISATNANQPSADGSNVASFVTSRSSSNTTDNGSPPTYGLLLAIVTVANAASSITNSNITDKRYNASNGAQNGSLIVQQNGTGTDATIQAAGIDANVNLTLTPKGTGIIKTKNPYKFSYSVSGASTSVSAAIVKFTTSIFDTGSNYSASTGLFTAPVAGFYLFNLTAYIGVSNSGVNSAQTILYKNGSNFRQLCYTNSSANTGMNLSVGGTALLSLAASDTVGLYALDTYGTNLTGTFEGFLLSTT